MTWIVSSVAELYFVLRIETSLHAGKNSQAFNRFIYTVFTAACFLLEAFEDMCDVHE